jgi:UDP:flavonoid glycosyltransferase YjiC (YdhE family)
MRVLFHGLGVVGELSSATADTIRSLLHQVLDDTDFRKRSQALSEVFQSCEQQQLGAQVIEDILGAEAIHEGFSEQMQIGLKS